MHVAPALPKERLKFFQAACLLVSYWALGVEPWKRPGAVPPRWCVEFCVEFCVAKSRAAAGSREDFLRVRESAAPKYKYDGAAEGVCPRPRVLRGRVVDARSV